MSDLSTSKPETTGDQVETSPHLWTGLTYVHGRGRLGIVDTLLEPLVRSPRLLAYLEELQQVVEDERAKRQQFYEDISPDDKWEFINGEVIMHSPATAKHIQVNERVHRLLKVYVDVHRLGAVHIEKVMISLTRNDYEPDIVFFSRSVAEKLEPSQWKFPAPQMVVEVLSPSTSARDRDVKFKDYAAHHIAEYWIVDPTAETIEQYLWRDGGYQLEVKLREGNVVCQAVAGFILPVTAAFDDELNLEALWKLQPRSEG